MSAQTTIVRETTGATIATLPYVPWPVTWSSPRVTRWTLAGIPALATKRTLTLVWGYGPAALLTQLMNLPSDRLTDWWLPIPDDAAGVVMRWGWVRGVWVPPEELATWSGNNWDQVAATLAQAVIV